MAIGTRFKESTEWNFGQLLPIAVVFLPFWALVQCYAGMFTPIFFHAVPSLYMILISGAEDWQAIIDEKKAAFMESQNTQFAGDNKMEKEKQHMLNNDISIDSQDGDSVENQIKDRTTIFRD